MPIAGSLVTVGYMFQVRYGVVNIEQLVMVLTDEILLMVKMNNVCTAGYCDDSEEL